MANFVKILGQILVTEGSEGLEARERPQNEASDPKGEGKMCVKVEPR